MLRHALGKRPLSSPKGWLSILPDPEKKSREPIVDDEFASAMSGASSIFTNPNLTYEFRLVRSQTISSTSGSAVYSAITWDVTQFSEFSSYLFYLFTEVRIRHAKMTLVGVSATGGASAAAAISSDLGFTATAPASALSVLENPNSRIVPMRYECGHDRTCVLDVRVPDDYLWGDVTSPALQVNTGTYGQFQLASMGSTTATGDYCVMVFEGVYEFRSRT